MKLLRAVGCRPENLQRADSFGFAQPNLFAQWIGAEAPSTVDPLVDRARLTSFLNL